MKLTPEEKQLIIATVVQIATEAMFRKHFYEFGDQQFQQREGGPIGLRGTCSVAQLVMQIFDRKWGTILEDQGVDIKLYARYMDDGRAFLHPLQRGWRWVGGVGLKFCLTWQFEDAALSPTEVTKRALLGSMEGVEPYLKFTAETGEDPGFNGWLPTLDLNIMVTNNNQIRYKYYEKPTTTEVTVQKNTAMAENPKIQILSNDLVRRFKNTSPELGREQYSIIIDGYA